MKRQQSSALGRKIKTLRIQRQWSVRQLAELVSVSPATISAIENARTGVSVRRLLVLAEAFETDPASLLEPGLISSTLRDESQCTVECSSNAQWRHFGPLDVDSIQSAAISCFVEVGYHGSTTRGIAERAQISVAGLYHHYASKQTLLVRILDMTMDELEWRASAARSSSDRAIVRVAALVEALALFHVLRRDLAFIGASEMRSLEPHHRDRIAERRSALQQMLDAEILEAIRSGDASTTMASEVGRAIATMCTSLPQWFNNDGPTSPEDIAAEYAALAVRMIGGREDIGSEAEADLSMNRPKMVSSR